MSSKIPPSKSEVMSWKPQTLANYMNKLKLSGCDRVAIQQNITGKNFLQMTECDLQVFPGYYCKNLKELQKAISNTNPSSRVNSNHRSAAVVQQEEDNEKYDPDECVYDNDSLGTSMTMIKTQKNQNLYQETLANPDSEKPKIKPKPAMASQRFGQQPEGSVHKDLSLSSSNGSSNYSLTQRELQSLSAQSSKLEEALDHRWYGGEMTRQEAAVALRKVDKDGAFVLRDSSKGRAEHPYTLMVLKDAKIYNIKIRKQGDCFSLGTGLYNKMSFPGVREIITHHAHTPLLLIDAKDSSSEAQRSLCCLLHPIGPRQ